MPASPASLMARWLRCTRGRHRVLPADRHRLRPHAQRGCRRLVAVRGRAGVRDRRRTRGSRRRGRGERARTGGRVSRDGAGARRLGRRQGAPPRGAGGEPRDLPEEHHGPRAARHGHDADHERDRGQRVGDGAPRRLSAPAASRRDAHAADEGPHLGGGAGRIRAARRPRRRGPTPVGRCSRGASAAS